MGFACPGPESNVARISRTRLAGYGVPAIVVPLLLTFLWIAWHLPIKSDDAYITFRVARHLADGRGMVYNPGERQQVSSSPLYTLLLAGARAATGVRIETAARAWEFLFLLINTILVAWIVVRLGGGRWAWLAALLVVSEPVIVFMSRGMESALFAACILATLAALRFRRPLLTAAFLALAVLTRLDGLILGLLVAGVELGRLANRSAPPGRWLRTTALQAVVFAALTLPWFLFAWAYFGDPFPVTIAHKLGQVRQLSLALFGPEFLRNFFWSHRLLVWNTNFPVPELDVIPFLIGAVVLATRRGPRFWLVGFWLLYLAVYAAARMPYYLWYQLPLYVIAAAVTTVGLAAMTSWALRRPTPGARWASGVALALLAIGIAVQILQVWPFLTLLATAPPDSSLRDTKMYAHAGRYLAAQSPPEAVVASFEVGMIGYYSQRRILDLTGLTSPLAAADRVRPALEVVLDRRPDFLVIESRVYERYPEYLRTRFEAAYRREKLLHDPYTEHTILIFRSMRAIRSE